MRFLNSLKTLLDDRLVIMAVPALLVLMTDLPVLFSLGYAVSIVVAIVAVAHSLRLLILPHIKMGELVGSAQMSPMASAIIFATVLSFMGLIVHSMVAWIQAAAGHVA
jgi:membrane protein insertase Oxa1/YidC/SpoIIIJ